MSTAVALVCRVARRRVERGEELTEVLKDYPRLTDKRIKENHRHDRQRRCVPVIFACGGKRGDVNAIYILGCSAIMGVA